MRRRWRIAIAVGIAVLAAFPALALYGRERAWEHVAPADLGPVEFATLQRSGDPNDALAATPGALPRGLEAELSLPHFDAPPERVIAAVEARVALLDADAVLVASDGTTRRYVTRSRWMRFPDTTVIEAVPTDGGTALRAYARASVGKSDFGANRARLERWLGGLEVDE